MKQPNNAQLASVAEFLRIAQITVTTAATTLEKLLEDAIIPDGTWLQVILYPDAAISLADGYNEFYIPVEDPKLIPTLDAKELLLKCDADTVTVTVEIYIQNNVLRST